MVEISCRKYGADFAIPAKYVTCASVSFNELLERVFLSRICSIVKEVKQNDLIVIYPIKKWIPVWSKQNP